MELGIVGIAWLDTALRLGLAAVLGGLIGLDRETSGKPAGFRTNILICVGAALLTELSIDIADRWVDIHDSVADPERIAAQIVSGIGFLGAGTILQSRLGVRGLTTAATIWVVAAIGMAVGGGAYALATIATVGVVVTLVLLSKVEAWMEPRTLDERMVRVELAGDDAAMYDRIRERLRRREADIRSFDVERQDGVTRAAFRVRARTPVFEDLIDELLHDPDVRRAVLE